MNRSTATVSVEMTTYRELLQRTKSEISEVDARGAEALEGATWIDIREADEWQEGHLPGAVHVPRGFLESRIEGVVSDKASPIVLYCAAANRSAFAAKTLQELGYSNAHSLAGGFTDWKRNGGEIVMPRTLSPDRRTRYSRHILIPEIGEEGQLKLLDSRILLIGAGGLGSPASLYLAAAGIGRIGIVDADIVDETNLQRQVAHSLETLGTPKVDSAKRAIEALNPDVDVVTYRERLTSENVERILGDGWDLIVDGADNFPTRYLVNDASVWHDIPVVHGSIYRFEGQVTVFSPHRAGSVVGKADDARRQTPGPCYRCLFPEPPPAELAPSCAEGGVLGVLPGIVGSLQTNEAIKLAAGIGEPLIGRLLLFDALSTEFSEVRIERNPDCPVCGDHPTITEYIDYVEFCAR
jgi:sulfur-carrier protein adenylyltransferase/sulfurtransferase